MGTAGVGEALTYIECITSISSIHKTEPKRAKLNSLGAKKHETDENWS